MISHCKQHFVCWYKVYINKSQCWFLKSKWDFHVYGNVIWIWSLYMPYILQMLHYIHDHIPYNTDFNMVNVLQCVCLLCHHRHFLSKVFQSTLDFIMVVLHSCLTWILNSRYIVVHNATTRVLSKVLKYLLSGTFRSTLCLINQLTSYKKGSSLALHLMVPPSIWRLSHGSACGWHFLCLLGSVASRYGRNTSLYSIAWHQACCTCHTLFHREHHCLHYHQTSHDAMITLPVHNDLIYYCLSVREQPFNTYWWESGKFGGIFWGPRRREEEGWLFQGGSGCQYHFVSQAQRHKMAFTIGHIRHVSGDQY